MTARSVPCMRCAVFGGVDCKITLSNTVRNTEANMLQRFDILLVLLIIYFADKLGGSRLPQPWTNGIILVCLVVLLLLGIVRY